MHGSLAGTRRERLAFFLAPLGALLLTLFLIGQSGESLAHLLLHVFLVDFHMNGTAVAVLIAVATVAVVVTTVIVAATVVSALAVALVCISTVAALTGSLFNVDFLLAAYSATFLAVTSALALSL